MRASKGGRLIMTSEGLFESVRNLQRSLETIVPAVAPSSGPTLRQWGIDNLFTLLFVLAIPVLLYIFLDCYSRPAPRKKPRW